MRNYINMVRYGTHLYAGAYSMPSQMPVTTNRRSIVVTLWFSCWRPVFLGISKGRHTYGRLVAVPVACWFVAGGLLRVAGWRLAVPTDGCLLTDAPKMRVHEMQVAEIRRRGFCLYLCQRVCEITVFRRARRFFLLPIYR